MTEREVFEVALEMPPQERAVYLDGSCGADVALRQRLEALLNKYEGAGSFLEEPAVPDLAVLDPPIVAEIPGAILGPYQLREQIGEGGFGIVFMAEQREPLRRKVALKVLKPGMDTRQVIARFEAERQALALMDHPNIAKVLDAGRTPSGRPYFVMELVKGIPITEYCNQNRLTAKERLALFVPICHAVQHAHHKGIIHRDLKPSNVLVTRQDGTPLVKVIDFGIAKALGEPLTDKTVLTGLSQLIGSPLYMSPEQAGLSDCDVDTRSDIYSLGVLLYELLTGTTPFDKERLSRVGYDEVRRIIREEEPAKPSTRITTLGQAAATVCSQRGSDPKRLPRLVRGELDWIVMKALEKDRNHRYETASAFAADVQRYLHNEPVLARRTSALERGWRWCRRNSVVASLSAAVLLLLAVFTAKAIVDRAHLAQALEGEQAKRWESLRDQARALRLSRHVGQRVEALASLSEAMKLPVPPGHSLAELRTEAVAALALPDLEVLREWPGGVTPGLLAVAFDPQMEWYARLAKDGTVTVNQVADDAPIAEWKEPAPSAWEPAVRALVFSPDGRYLALYHRGSKQVIVRRLEGKEARLCHRADEVRDHGGRLDFSREGDRLAYLKASRRVALVNLATGETHDFPPTDADEFAVRFAPDGQRIAVGMGRGGKGSLEIRDLRTGRALMTLPHPAPVAAVRWHPDGFTLVTCCNDRLIRIWDPTRCQVLRTLEGHRSDGVCCAFDATGSSLLSIDWSPILRVWETSSGRQMLAFPARGYPFFLVSSDNRLAVGQQVDARSLQCLQLHSNPAYRTVALQAKVDLRYPASVHPAGRMLAACSGDQIALVDLETGRALANLPGAAQPLLWESGDALLAAGSSGLLRWPVQRRTVPSPQGNDGNGAAFRFQAPQQLLANNSAGVWGISAGGLEVAIPQYEKGSLVVHLSQKPGAVRLGPQRDVRHCAVSQDGCWVATGNFNVTEESGVKIWQSATGRLEKLLPVHGDPVTFSPDNRWLLTTGRGCRLWKVGTWTEGPAVGGARACFSPDSRLLAVQDTIGSIRLISTDTGELVVRLEAPEQTCLMPCCFTPDNTRLVTVGIDTDALHIWDLRKLRQGLAALGLDWDEPPYAPGPSWEAIPNSQAPLQVTVESGKALENCIELGQWDRAAALLEAWLAQYPNDHLGWYFLAAVRLQTGSAEGYRRACREMLARFGATRETAIAERTAKTCALAPGAVADFDGVIKLADLAVRREDPDRWILLTRGLIDYRAGHCSDALGWLQRVAPREGGDSLDATAFVVEAMARLGLRQNDEARQALSRAHAIIDEKMPDPAKGGRFGGEWHDWLRGQILCREADRLVKKAAGEPRRQAEASPAQQRPGARSARRDG